MYKEFTKCTLCPRNCSVNRNNNEIGFCGADNTAEVSRIGLHTMEEPVISGSNGSGTVFFTHCTLGCIYCQNFQISRKNSIGKKYTAEELAHEYLKLEALGAHNINLVSPTQYLPIVKESCIYAKKSGLKIPFVYNTGGFEKAENISKLNGVIDIFLTDIKYYSPYLSGKYSLSEDYFDYASEATEEMIKISGLPKYDNNGLLKKGVIIRHLILPKQINDSKSILRAIYNKWNGKVLVSLMRQYTPISDKLPDELKRTVTVKEYTEVADYMDFLGLEGYLQTKDSVGTDKIPVWNEENIFVLKSNTDK